MNRTNCVPGGKATQAARSPERRRELGAMGGKARAACSCARCSAAALSAIGRKGGLASRARLTPEQRSESARRAVRARWNKEKS